MEYYELYNELKDKYDALKEMHAEQCKTIDEQSRILHSLHIDLRNMRMEIASLSRLAKGL
jgi:uncharacterized coiled-coil DUF342 family protein